MLVLDSYQFFLKQEKKKEKVFLENSSADNVCCTCCVPLLLIFFGIFPVTWHWLLKISKDRYRYKVSSEEKCEVGQRRVKVKTKIIKMGLNNVVFRAYLLPNDDLEKNNNYINAYKWHCSN